MALAQTALASGDLRGAALQLRAAVRAQPNNGNAHLRLAQGRCVVRTIAAHADDMSVALKCLDQAILILRKNTREDGEFGRFKIIR